MNIRQKAQAKIKKLKKDLKKGHEIAKMAGLSESVISRIYNGREVVTLESCQQVLDRLP